MTKFFKPRRAKGEDYIAIQGGKPRVKRDGGLIRIRHDYPGGEGMEVVSHKGLTSMER